MRPAYLVASWIVCLVLLGAGLSYAGVARAQPAMFDDITKQVSSAAGPQGAGYGYPTDPRTIVSLIIRALLGLVGTVLFVYILYAGYIWMTAAGNSEQVEKAQAIIKNGVIGLIVVLSAYTITIAAANISRGLPAGWGTGWAGFVNSFF